MAYFITVLLLPFHCELLDDHQVHVVLRSYTLQLSDVSILPLCVREAHIDSVSVLVFEVCQLLLQQFCLLFKRVARLTLYLQVELHPLHLLDVVNARFATLALLLGLLSFELFYPLLKLADFIEQFTVFLLLSLVVLARFVAGLVGLV